MKSSLKKLSIYFSLGIFTTLLIANLHIEWLWFEQFQLQSIFVKRIILQISYFIVGSLISYLMIKWQLHWKNHCYGEDNSQQENQIRGKNYGCSLIIGLSSIAISLILMFLVAWVSIVNPLTTPYWWTYIVNIDQTVTFVTSILSFTLLLLLINRKGVLYLQTIYSILFITIFTRSWGVWSLALNISPTGINEPLFGSDISFGLAIYPALVFVFTLITLLLTSTLGLSGWIYLTSMSRFSDWAAPILSERSKNLLRPIIATLILNILSITWLSRHQFLWTQRGIVPGAGWLDIHFNIPLRVLSSLFLIFLLINLIPINYKRKKNIRIISTFLFLTSIIGELILTPILEWIVVRPRELKLESPYLERAIKATRNAFQLDSIKTKLINPNSRITKRDLLLGESTLKNIRLWDSQPLLDTNRQLQQLRQYYRFTNVAIDRYRLKSSSIDRQQVMITARELDHNQLPKSSRTWLNKHFVFTHGYGFTVSPINTKAQDGLPEYFISDLGESAKIQGSKFLNITKEDVKSSLPIGKAAIYYGMLPSSYVIAPSNIKELDYPQGDKNIFNHYEGKGGVPLRNLLQRLSAAIYLKEPRLLNTGSLTPNSKLLLKREVRQRVKAIAPFLDIIGEPYLISISIPETSKDFDNNQKQYWIVEGYTNSVTYPYAAKLPDGNPIRYIRNSVKAVIDSYNGSIQMYISEPKDPLIKAWSDIFPRLFKPINEMPVEVKEHLRVPIELFNLQVQQILRYHVTDARTFYNGDDLWQVPMELYGSTEIPVEPYHITAQLGDNNASEFLLLQPLSPLARPNLAAWLAARNDGENYGKLVLLKFPSDTTIFGPEQIQALINQNPSISQQFSLWDRAGSEVIQGNLLVLPVGEALLYVEPVYLKASMGGLPTLTRIVVSDGKRISMAETLSEGIKDLLNQFNNEEERR
ncbi:UPF0182 family protein [Prochlorococcus sp. MIT 1307]|uniref:UPF0182 family protein n=1 Tax=Prochlorococcus sp. MIT 1307 TaxID=3096219 RepID=UPI002A75A05A|nr:UPF0182 family protein [Prochlorococcus sp. MIT 1307]